MPGERLRLGLGRGLPEARRRRLLPLFVFAALASSTIPSACTTYRAVSGDPPVAQPVRVRLAPEGQVRAAQATGAARASLEGQVLALEPDAFVLEVPIPGIDPALHREAKTADTIRVLRADVTAAETQHFSRIRTGLLAGGIAAGVVGVVFIGTSGSSGGVDDGPGHRSAFRSFLSFAIPTGR